MKKLLKYETPEIEVTRFNLNSYVMADYDGDAGNGDGVTDFRGPSLPDGGAELPTFDWGN